MAITQPVLIIGGGLSGLSLAQALKHQGIPYKLFERDAGKDDRMSQGWSISMHFCLPALSKAIDPSHFSTLGSKASVNTHQPDNIQFTMVDGITNKKLVSFDLNSIQASLPKGQSYPMFRINRRRFRAWLLEGLDVTWMKRLESYRILSDDEQAGGGVEATFTDGTTARGSVLVGADGVNSMVCKQLMAIEKDNTDAFNQATTVNPTRCLVVLRWLTEDEYAPLRELSKIHLMAFGALHRGKDQKQETVGLFVSLNDIDPNPNVKRRFQVILSLSRFDESQDIPWYNDNKDRLQQFKSWAKDGFEGDLQKVLLEAPEGDDDQDQATVTYITLRERYPQSDCLAKHQGRIALVGDAAHTMTMFRGEGGNHAILDATVLGQALGDAYNVDKETTLYDAIEKYNKEMIPRGTKAVEESHQAAYNAHKAPHLLVKSMELLINAVKTGTVRQL
ncbi:hypothetical protein BCR42DRAFT_449365 [Absidia repens]|uniref:FAD-binding domain-containing protein n=1 Tax=Absidia repens TaxID=90262 RepID=A0A1X2INQ7_9FUNG|nr:hypothetical protein BCR42DRAFT_449365 [Absidia repens]